MALRLIEIVLQKKYLDEVRNFLECHSIIEHRELKLQSDKMLVRILLEAQQSGPVLNFFEEKYTSKLNHLIIMPVEAVMPRLEDIESVTIKKQKRIRISTEELYEDIQSSAQYSYTFLAMLILATIVAAIGLHDNSTVAIIGAMVIAPLLGPILAIGIGVVLGESKLLLRAIITAIIGIAVVMILGVVISSKLAIDPTVSEIASRTYFEKGDLAIALASGFAGALAFTTGVAETIIGVMVAVSLLPPLVTCALLAGSGYINLAVGAFELFILNLASVNFASIVVFLIQGIHPIKFYLKPRYYKFMYFLILISWLLVLALMLSFFEFSLVTDSP